MQKSGNRVRIFARLNHAATEQERWSQSFGPLELDDVFATQERIAQAIVGGVHGLLTGAGGVETSLQIQAQVKAAQLGGTRHAEAHGHYLRGGFLLTQFSVEKANEAVATLQRAVALDGQFAAAWAAMSHAGWLIHGFGSTRHEYEEGVRIARESAAKAIAVEPRLPAGHLGRFNLQLTYDFDWRGAAESLQRARELAPGDSEVILASASFAFTLGRLERAVELFQQTVVLDPETPKSVGVLA